MDDDENDTDNLFAEYEAEDNATEERENDAQNENGAVETANPSAPTGTRVTAPKRVIKNPRLKFNADRLIGERGIPVLVDHFKNIKFKGKGHEERDLDKLLSTLELWTHRLFPSMTFEDTLKQIEKLGHKRPVQTCMQKIRMDMPVQYCNTVVEEEDNVRRNEDSEPEIDPDDAFNQLLGQRNESVPDNDDDIHSQVFPVHTVDIETPSTSGYVLGHSNDTGLTEEQRKRMEYNRMLAAERRKAALSSQSLNTSNAVMQKTNAAFDEPEPSSSNGFLTMNKTVLSTNTEYLTIDEPVPSTSTEYLTIDEPVPSTSTGYLTIDEPSRLTRSRFDHELSLSPELSASIPTAENYISPFTENSTAESEPQNPNFEDNVSCSQPSRSCDAFETNTEEPMSISILNGDDRDMSTNNNALSAESSHETSSLIQNGIRDDSSDIPDEGETLKVGNPKDLSLDDILDIFDEDDAVDDIPVKKKRLNRISSSESEMSDD